MDQRDELQHFWISESEERDQLAMFADQLETGVRDLESFVPEKQTCFVMLASYEVEVRFDLIWHHDNEYADVKDAVYLGSGYIGKQDVKMTASEIEARMAELGIPVDVAKLRSLPFWVVKP